MKRHTLTIFLALLVSGGAFALNQTEVDHCIQLSTIKYEVTVEIKDNNQGGEYFINKASQLLNDQHGFTVLSTTTEGKAITFLIEGTESSSAIADVEQFFNENGYMVMSTKTIN